MTEPWVSVDDVAGHLGVAKDSVYRWIETRGLPASKLGRLWKFKLSEVDDGFAPVAPRIIRPIRRSRRMNNDQVDAGRRAGSVDIAGLDLGVPYFSRLSARSALYTDLRLLLDGQSQAHVAATYRRLIVKENCLARPTNSARRKLWQELHSRYRLDARDPLFSMFWTEWERCSSDPERSLTAYVLLALNDRLVVDLGTELLFPLLRQAPAELRVDDVLVYIQHLARSRPEVARWSEKSTLAVAQKYCASIRDFGLARGTVRKTTVRPALYGSPVRLLVRALDLVSAPSLAVVQHPIFRLLGIAPTEVIDAFGELNRQGALRFRMQGDVVELDLAEAA